MGASEEAASAETAAPEPAPVEAKDEAKLVGLLEDCFGLGDDLARNAAQAVLARYSG